MPAIPHSPHAARLIIGESLHTPFADAAGLREALRQRQKNDAADAKTSVSTPVKRQFRPRGRVAEVSGWGAEAAIVVAASGRRVHDAFRR